jgi:hypothetical protein
MGDDGKEEAGVHKVDTVPPPPGEADAYNAPTRVGPVSQAAWAELIEKANEKNDKTAEEASNAPRSEPSARPPTPTPAAGAAPADGGAVPRIYEEPEDEDAATLLHPSARKQVLANAGPPGTTTAPPPPPVPKFPEIAAPPPPSTSNPGAPMFANAASPLGPIAHESPPPPAHWTARGDLVAALIAFLLAIAVGGITIAFLNWR